MTRPKYGILRLDTLRLIGCSTKDEAKNLLKDLRREGVTFRVFKDYGSVYGEMDAWVWYD